jgi:hypothetical protein
MSELINIFSKYKKEFDISDDSNIINVKVSESTFNNQTILNFYAVTQNDKYEMFGEVNIGSLTFFKENENITYCYGSNKIKYPILRKSDKRNYLIIKELDNYMKIFL